MSRRRVIGLACLFVVTLVGGCKMPAASLQLLDGLDTALGNVSAGQQTVRQVTLTGLQAEQASLDAAFEADLRNLAAGGPNPATQEADPTGGTVKLADVLTAKRLYDSKRVEIQSSQAGVSETFDRLDNNLSASRQMVNMLRQLALQDNALSGQANLAVSTLLNKSPTAAKP